MKKHVKYSILHRLKRGASISISPTFRCNYRCEYCTLNIASTSRKVKESTLLEWLEFIDKFPLKLKEVHITGGEPTLMPYNDVLIQQLIKRKILVTLFTNLSKPINVNPSPYFRIHASYHHSQTTTLFFSDLYYEYKKSGYQITVDEIGQKWLPFSDLKPELKTISDLETVKPRIRIAPDRSGYFTTCLI